jgi:hypothetical protein
MIGVGIAQQKTESVPADLYAAQSFVREFRNSGLYIIQFISDGNCRLKHLNATPRSLLNNNIPNGRRHYNGFYQFCGMLRA